MGGVQEGRSRDEELLAQDRQPAAKTVGRFGGGMFKEFNVLLVEDDPGDIFLIKKAFARNDIKARLHITRNGVEATDFLYRGGKYANAPRPDIVILDLNLPKKDGRELLAEIKADPELGMIPVIIFTTSKSDKDILTSYSLHANSYVIKVADWEDFSKIVDKIKEFWLSTARIP
jgi:CheY-like chemotaxis protein